MPKDVSAAVAAHAMYGIVARGMKEFTSAAYFMKRAKCFRSRVPSHRPNREATAERKALPSARRAKRLPDALPIDRADFRRRRSREREIRRGVRELAMALEART